MVNLRNRTNNSASRLTNESGMGILQMLMLVAVSGVVIASIASALVTMMKSSQTVAQSLEQDLFQEQTAQLMADTGICTTNVLQTNTFDLSGAVTPMSFQLPYADVAKNIVAGGAISANFEILQVTNKISSAAMPFAYSGAAYSHYDTTVSIQLKKINTSTFVQSMKPFDIHLDLVVDAGGVPKACSAVSAGSAACLAEGGVWNPLASPGEKCIALKYCQYGGSYADASDADGGFINTLSGGRSCPPDFTPQQSGTINKAASTGKYSVSNSPSKVYTCMKCGKTLAPAGPAYPAGPLPMTAMNQEIYDAIAYSQENDALIAEADTKKALDDYNAGVAQSNAYQAQVDQANSNIANANASVAYYQNDYNSAVAAYNSASNDYNAAASIPDSVVMASAQNAMSAASLQQSNDQSSISYWQGQIPPNNQTVTTYTQAKQTQDTQNATLYQIWVAKKMTSDALRTRANASKLAAQNGQEPVD